MKKHFLMPIFALLDELNVWDERVEQVQMELDRNPEIYSRCNRRRREYRDARHAFEDAHPDVRNELDSIISLYGSYMTEVAVEAYKQGAVDLNSFLRILESRSSTTVGKKEDEA